MALLHKCMCTVQCVHFYNGNCALTSRTGLQLHWRRSTVLNGVQWYRQIASCAIWSGVGPLGQAALHSLCIMHVIQSFHPLQPSVFVPWTT